MDYQKPIFQKSLFLKRTTLAIVHWGLEKMCAKFQAQKRHTSLSANSISKNFHCDFNNNFCWQRHQHAQLPLLTKNYQRKCPSRKMVENWKRLFSAKPNASLFHLHSDETIDVFGFMKKALVVMKHPQWGVKRATFLPLWCSCWGGKNVTLPKLQVTTLLTSGCQKRLYRCWHQTLKIWIFSMKRHMLSTPIME